MPTNPPPQPYQGDMPVTPPPQSGQVEMHPEHELMELDILEDMPDLIDIPEEMLSDFDTLAHSVLNYEW